MMLKGTFCTLRVVVVEGLHCTIILTSSLAAGTAPPDDKPAPISETTVPETEKTPEGLLAFVNWKHLIALYSPINYLG